MAKAMTVSDLRALLDGLEGSSPVYVSTYSCGATTKRPLISGEVVVEEGFVNPVTIIAEDN